MISIEVKNLTKRFGNFTAVDGISFTIKKGEIFGFLGANGSGKTTTIRMLCGLLLPTNGEAKVAGFDIVKESEKIKHKIGYMSQKFSLYEDLTVEENINFFAGVYSLSEEKIKMRKKLILEITELKGKEKRLTKELPPGWRQKLALATALLHEPEILFLDEPTSGVDPLAREKFWDLINSLSEMGITIFVTTHYLDEAEYCNRVALIHRGKIVAIDTPYGLKTNYINTHIIELIVSYPFLALSILEKQSFIHEVSLFGNYLHISIQNLNDVKRIKDILIKNKIQIKSMKKIIPTIEDLFIYLVKYEGEK